jgi:HK97 family phage major capsid protein
MKHFPFPMTASAAALLAAGQPLHRKDAGADPFETLTKSFEEHAAETLRRIGETDQKMATFAEQIAALEQRAARGGGGVPAAAPSWGEAFVQAKSPDLARIGLERGRTSFEMKATITNATAAAAGSAGALVVPERDAMVGMPRRRLTIRNLLSVVQVSSGSVEYAEQTLRDLKASPVAEQALKPQSDLGYQLKTTPIRTIAHWVKASRQILDDSPQLRDQIDTELRYGLAIVEEAQLLHGDGTGQNLLGMVPSAAAFDDPLDLPEPNMIDQIGSAILQASLTDVAPDGIVLHPADWWRMRLTKDEEGKYILGDPMAVVQPVLFGLPVVPTQAMAVDTFLVGSFGSQVLYDRWQARVEVGFDGDDFTRNLVTILGEERIGFAAKRPDTLIHGTFGNAGT